MQHVGLKLAHGHFAWSRCPLKGLERQDKSYRMIAHTWKENWLLFKSLCYACALWLEAKLAWACHDLVASSLAKKACRRRKISVSMSNEDRGMT